MHSILHHNWKEDKTGKKQIKISIRFQYDHEKQTLKNGLRTLLIVLIICLIPMTAFSISLQKEEEMGQEFMKVVLEHYDIIEDPLVVDYVNKIGQHVASVFPDKFLTIIFTSSKNRPTMHLPPPAGHVFINSGLFEAMDSEEELAGILAMKSPMWNAGTFLRN